MADFALFLHPGVLFVVPKEEHLMMVLFSSYGWYPEYRVVPETSGLPEISGNTRCFGLPATRWFLKLNRVGYRKKYRVASRVRVPAGHCRDREREVKMKKNSREFSRTSTYRLHHRCRAQKCGHGRRNFTLNKPRMKISTWHLSPPQMALPHMRNILKSAETPAFKLTYIGTKV